MNFGFVSEQIDDFHLKNIVEHDAEFVYETM